MDPRGLALLRQARSLGVKLESARTARVYLIRASLSPALVERVSGKLLANPVTERALAGVSDAGEPRAGASGQIIEVHPLPGVMDPAAQSVREAVTALIGGTAEVEVSTGWRYDLAGIDAASAQQLARRMLANPAIHQIHTGPWTPQSLPSGKAYTPTLRHVPIRSLSDQELVKLSREAHLFLSPEEMRSLRDEYRKLDREPTDIELETIAQTWSEHCVHKTIKSTVRYTGVTPGDPIRWGSLPGTVRHGDGSVTITNLLKSTVAAATHELIADGIDWALSVFKDNSGVVALDEKFGVCIKVETHNRPSAIEPYGGAATGIGGCIRDVIGTGLGSRPIASTDVFVVAHPDHWSETGAEAGAGVSALPPGAIHPKRVLTEVVAGIRDYGNRMGIPTVSGAVYFDDRHVGNPLVFAGCIGLIPREFVKGAAKAGDRIIALGGRTGRDGIHGATFSSAEMESTHADEFSHAVQIGNAIEEKRVLEAILRARDEGAALTGKPLYNGMTDCGAGGFSSAIGEMGSSLGATVQLERAPLKYQGLSYTEIWISEAQERMVLAVPAANLEALRRICDQEQVELADLGEFGTPGAELVLRYHDLEVGRLPMSFLHDGIPMPTREAVWAPPPARSAGGAGRTPAAPTRELLLGLLSHPNIASKQWIIRQYDHEVRGQTTVKPLVGRTQRGPSDASVIKPLADSSRGIAISCGLQTGIGDPENGGDPYEMVIGAIDECVRNLVCVGADPARIAILDNFCWPGCAPDYPRAAENMGALVRASAGCYEGAKAYRTPFVSGKDSLNNQLRYTDPETGERRLIQIPPTLLITGMGIVHDVNLCVTMDAKRAENVLVLVGATRAALGGSHVAALLGTLSGALGAIPTTDLKAGPAAAAAVAGCIAAGLVRSAHDVSDGGLLSAVAEMLIAHGSLGARVDLAEVHADPLAAAFSESSSRYVLEIEAAQLANVLDRLAGVGAKVIGELDAGGVLRWAGGEAGVAELTEAWTRPLAW